MADDDGAVAPTWDDSHAVRHAYVLSRLMPHQREAYAFILSRGGCGLIGDEMGLGKSYSALAAAHYYAEDWWPLCICCPATLMRNWQAEIIQWMPWMRPGVDVVIVKNASTATKDLWRGSVRIVSYDLLKRPEVHGLLLHKTPPKEVAVTTGNKKKRKRDADDSTTKQKKTQSVTAARGTGAPVRFVIGDESHYLKSRDSERTRAVRKVTKNQKLLLLSGTPMPNRPSEMFAQLQLIMRSHAPPNLYPPGLQQAAPPPRRGKGKGDDGDDSDDDGSGGRVRTVPPRALSMYMSLRDLIEADPGWRLKNNGRGLQPELFVAWVPFTDRYCDAKTSAFARDTSGSTPQSNAELHKLLIKNVMIMRRKEDVLTSLPPKVRRRVEVQLSKETKQEMAEREEELKRAMELYRTLELKTRESNDGIGINPTTRKPVTAKDVARSMSDLRQQVTELRKATCEAKIDDACRMVQKILQNSSTTTKWVIFAYFKASHRRLAEALNEINGYHKDDSTQDSPDKWTYVTINGATKMSDRQYYVDVFQGKHPEAAANCRVAIVSTQLGIGLNLTSASNVIFEELPWDPSTAYQCEDRVHRIGQTKTCNIYYLLAPGSFDDRLWRMVSRKSKIQGQVLHNDGSRTLSNSTTTITEEALWSRLLGEAGEKEQEEQEEQEEEGDTVPQPDADGVYDLT